MSSLQTQIQGNRSSTTRISDPGFLIPDLERIYTVSRQCRINHELKVGGQAGPQTQLNLTSSLCFYCSNTQQCLFDISSNYGHDDGTGGKFILYFVCP